MCVQRQCRHLTSRTTPYAYLSRRRRRGRCGMSPVGHQAGASALHEALATFHSQSCEKSLSGPLALLNRIPKYEIYFRYLRSTIRALPCRQCAWPTAVLLRVSGRSPEQAEEAKIAKGAAGHRESFAGGYARLVAWIHFSSCPRTSRQKSCTMPCTLAGTVSCTGEGLLRYALRGHPRKH